MDTIINRGRGPEIAGTRITVYNILDYTRLDWTPSAIAGMFEVSVPEVLAAMQYIEEHKEEVMAEYQKILERVARGNPPEIQAKLDAIHAKYKILWADRFRAAGMVEENGDAGAHGG